MDVSIRFSHSASSRDSLRLSKLADALQHDYDLPVESVRREPVSGTKDGGLPIALSIVGISIAAIEMIISALEYWKSQQPEYSISIKSGDGTIVVEAMSLS
jgi:hypothetical protein